MELTNILGRLKSDQEPPKPFLALELTDEVVAAAVWHVEDNVTQVVSLGIPMEWKNQGEKASDNLVEAVDATISSATEGLPLEPSEAVFGLPSSWTTSKGIDPAKLKLIKLVSSELELKPLGFVVLIDSLLRYLKMQEGTPSTSLLIHVTNDDVTVNHVTNGKIEGNQTVGRSDDISLDVEEAISRLKITGNLPSRIIVFDGLHDLEDIVQNLISYDWQARFKFLHLPKVESLPSDIVIKSIAVAGGAEVAKSIGFEITEPKPIHHSTEQAPVAPITTSPSPDSNFGFSESEPIKPPQAPSTPPPPTPSSPQPPPIKKSPLKLKLRLPPLPHFNYNLARIKPGGKLGIISATLVFAAISLVSAVWFIPHATVTIFVKPKVLDEKISITLSTTVSSINLEDSIVPAKLLSTSVSGTDKVNATGKKTIGDPASGEVTIYNRTELVKTFTKDTVLESNGITFTLDDDVTVASSSSGSNYELVPGKASVKITASSIGEEGNLGENTEFSVGSYSNSTYVARNESSLSGGNSSEINVVSQEDLETLLENLTNKLEEEARAELLSSSGEGSGIYLLEDSITLSDESYSAKVGEEASSLEGTIKVEIEGIHYLTTNVEELVTARIEDAIPSGYQRTNDLPTVELSSAKSEGDSEVLAEAKVSIYLLPELDQTSFQNTLKGLSSEDVKSVLSDVTGLDSARVIITPKFLPPAWKMMPRNPGNIIVSIESAN